MPQRESASEEIPGTPAQTHKHTHDRSAPPPFTNEVRAQAEMHVIDLLATHPRAETRTLLSELLTPSAMLDVSPTAGVAGKNAASIFCLQIPNRDLVYGLGASYIWALDPGMPDESRYLTLWHEYTHWHDYQTGLTDVSVCLRKGGPEGSRDLDSWLRSELRAHLAECELAAAMGWDHPDRHCQRYVQLGRADFVRSVANSYIERSTPLKPLAIHLREVTECFIAGD